MARQWKCARCGTKNVETTLTCSNCRMIRGAVVVKTDTTPAAWATPEAWSAPEASPPAPTDAVPSPVPTPTYWGQADVAADGGSRTRLVIPALFLIVGLVGAAIAVATASPEAPEGSAAGSDYLADQFAVGDCLDIADISAEEVSGIEGRPCNREHEYEVIFTGPAEGVGYPTDAAFDDFFAVNCIPAFESYVGEAFEESVLDIFWLIPTREAWRQGDRTIQCLVYHPSVKRLTQSLKGAGRLRAGGDHSTLQTGQA
jgi:hypothetical protein